MRKKKSGTKLSANELYNIYYNILKLIIATVSPPNPKKKKKFKKKKKKKEKTVKQKDNLNTGWTLKALHKLMAKLTKKNNKTKQRKLEETRKIFQRFAHKVMGWES